MTAEASVPLAEPPRVQAATQWLSIYVNDDAHWPQRDHPRRTMLRVILSALEQHERAMAALRGSAAALRRARAGLSVAIRAAVEDIDFDPGEHHAIKDIDAALAALADAASAAGDAG